MPGARRFDRKLLLVLIDNHDGAHRRIKGLRNHFGDDLENAVEITLCRDRMAYCRDQFDASRTVAPMSRAADAVEVDTDGLAPPEVIARIVELAQERGAPWQATSLRRSQQKQG